MGLLAQIANPYVADVAGNIAKGQTHRANMRQADLTAQVTEEELKAARTPKTVSWKDQLEELGAKAEFQWQVAASLLAETDPEKRAQKAAQYGFMRDKGGTLLGNDPAAPNMGGPAVDLSDERLEEMLAEAAYGRRLTDETSKGLQDAAILDARGDTEGAALVRKNLGSKYGNKDAKIERVELFDRETNESFWVTKAPDGVLTRNGRPLTEEELDKYTEKGVTRSAVGDPAAMGLNKPVASAVQKDVVENRVQQETLNRLVPLYSKDFLTLQGNVKGAFLWGLDKIDALPPGQQKEWLAAKTKFDAGVNQAFNIYRRWVTGAAAAMSELERLEAAYINTKDSPTQFMAKLAEIYDFSKRVDQVRMGLLEQGLKPGTAQWKEEMEAAWIMTPPEAGTTAEHMAEFLEYEASKK